MFILVWKFFWSDEAGLQVRFTSAQYSIRGQQQPITHSNFSSYRWVDFFFLFQLTTLSQYLEVFLPPFVVSSQAEYFTCVATLLYARKENCLYQACPSTDCNKKVIDQHNGLYRCEKCGREYPNFKYRLLLSVSANSAHDLHACHNTAHFEKNCNLCVIA